MKVLISMTLLLVSINLIGQSISRSVIASSSKSANQSPQLDWTLGENIVDAFGTNQSVLTGGFHQGSLVITSIEDYVPDLSIKVYPNPTVSSIIVEYDSPNELNGTLFSVSGKVILQQKIAKSKDVFDLDHLTTGIYFLRISAENKVIKTFKVHKVK